MEPRIKSNLQNTYHRDGTVSFWSVYLQQWKRQPAAELSDRDLATFRETERQQIAAHKARPWSVNAQ